MENEINKDTTEVIAEETTTYTKKELANLMQSETDKRVTSALKTAKASWESEMSTRIDSHLKDFEKKSLMSPDQLKQLDLDEKFKMLDKKEKDYIRMTKEMEISKKLQDKKLSSVLTKFVYSDNDDEVEQNIVTLENLVLGLVNEEVEKRISSSKPRASVNTKGLDKEGFKKLSIAERSELYRTNPTQYKELSK